MRQLAGPRLRVQALPVPRLALLERRRSRERARSPRAASTQPTGLAARFVIAGRWRHAITRPPCRTHLGRDPPRSASGCSGRGARARIPVPTTDACAPRRHRAATVRPGTPRREAPTALRHRPAGERLEPMASAWAMVVLPDPDSPVKNTANPRAGCGRGGPVTTLVLPRQVMSSAVTVQCWRCPAVPRQAAATPADGRHRGQLLDGTSERSYTSSVLGRRSASGRGAAEVRTGTRQERAPR